MLIKHKKIIKLRPKKWTKHHTHRVLHVSGLAVAIIALASMSGVFGTRLADVQAEDTSLITGVGVTIADVDSGPTVVLSNGGGGSTPVTPINPTPPITHPTVDAQPVATPKSPVTQATIIANGTSHTQYVFDTQYPQFAGHTDIRNGLVHLVIEGKYTITGNVYTNQNGDWSWQPTIPVSVENHTLVITATDQNEAQINAKTILYFTVKLKPGQAVEFPVANNTVDMGNGGNLFDVIVGVPQQFKVITAGDEIVAKIKFINFGSSGHSVDVEAQFTIRDADDKVVMKSSQTVAVATQLSILKTFYTNQSMAPGIYTITASVPSEDLVATATDTFQVKAIPVAATTSAPPINYTLTLQALGAMIILFSFITYMEYNKVEMLSSTIKQITEQDLADQA